MLQRTWILASVVVFSSSFSVFAAPVSGTSALGLQELYGAGLSASETVQQSEELRIQAEETKKRSTGSLLPTINGVGTFVKQDDPNTGLGSSISPTTQRTVKLTGKQYIFQGGSEYSYLGQTKKLLAAATENVKAEKQRYYLNVASLYFTALLRARELDHAAEEVKLYDDQLKELRQRARIGRSRSSDVLSVDAARAQTEARRRTAESSLRNVRIELASLTRTSETAPLREELPYTGDLKPLDFYLKAAEERPDLKAASLRREAAESAIGVARGGHYPAVDVTGNYYFERPGVNSQTKWDATLNVTVPIFAGGTTQSRVREASSEFRSAEIEFTLLSRELRLEVQSLYQTLHAAEEEVKALETAEELATRNYRQTQKDFRFGLVNNLDLVQAMRDLQQARRTLDSARYQRYLERVQLEVAAGLLPKSS